MYVIFTWSLFKLSFKYPLFKRNLIVHLSVKDRLRSSKVKFSGKNEKEVQVETDQSNFKQPCDWFLEISRWFLTGNALGTRMEKKPNGNLMYRLRRTCHWNWSFHAGGTGPCVLFMTDYFWPIILHSEWATCSYREKGCMINLNRLTRLLPNPFYWAPIEPCRSYLTSSITDSFRRFVDEDEDGSKECNRFDQTVEIKFSFENIISFR